MTESNKNLWIVVALFNGLALAVVTGFVFGPRHIQRPSDDTDTITEQVEQITHRIQLRHVGCAEDGYWERCGAAERIEGDGVFKDVYLYPHKCSGCGATQTLYNVSYPQFRREWRVVK